MLVGWEKIEGEVLTASTTRARDAGPSHIGISVNGGRPWQLLRG